MAEIGSKSKHFLPLARDFDDFVQLFHGIPVSCWNQGLILIEKNAAPGVKAAWRTCKEVVKKA
jgi:hypothetical protein